MGTPELAALRSLFDRPEDEGALTEGVGGNRGHLVRRLESGSRAPDPGDAGAPPGTPSVNALPLLPLLQPLDEPRLEQAPHRFLYASERGDDWHLDHDTWRTQRERDQTLFGERDVSTRHGWTKDAA